MHIVQNDMLSFSFSFVVDGWISRAGRSEVDCFSPFFASSNLRGDCQVDENSSTRSDSEKSEH